MPADKARLRSVKEDQAYGLRLEGHTYKQIALALGFSDPKVASRYVERSRRRHPTVDIDERKHVAGERIEALIRALWPDALAGKVFTIDRVLALLAREAALFGLDAPAKVEVRSLPARAGTGHRGRAGPRCRGHRPPGGGIPLPLEPSVRPPIGKGQRAALDAALALDELEVLRQPHPAGQLPTGVDHGCSTAHSSAALAAI